MGFIEGPPAVKRKPGPTLFITKLDLTKQQEKFERKSIVSSTSMELP